MIRPRSGRPSTANDEYSIASSPEPGMMDALHAVAVRQPRCCLAPHRREFRAEPAQFLDQRPDLGGAPARATSSAKGPTTKRATLSQSALRGTDAGSLKTWRRMLRCSGGSLA